MRNPPIKLERARDADKKLARFLTGCRFLFITVPTRPLEKSLRVNLFTAKLCHKEQKQVNILFTLFDSGPSRLCMHKQYCVQKVQTQHKRGDNECSLGQNSKEKNSDTDSRRARTAGKSKGEDEKSVNGPKKDDRRRTGVWQRKMTEGGPACGKDR